MYRLFVRGVVQGVGFRPFVYRLASSMGLKGYVKNTGDGTVEIVIDRDVYEFIERLKKEKPPISTIDEVRIEEYTLRGRKFKTFFIEKSGGGRNELSLPPPDVAICDCCLAELFNDSDRRYHYSFISCTDCGPRFGVAVSLPYDRENTTFNEFPLCEHCSIEYQDVSNRRYYAQSIACPDCGPDYKLYSRGKKLISSGYAAIVEASRLLENNFFVAVKGLGGYHIASKTDDDIVAKLRKVLRRPQQPFAIMARDIKALKKIVLLSDDEINEIQSYIRPITVLRKREESEFYQVAPELDTIGVMLPYAPVHYLLFENLITDYIVMTSANLPGEPMFIDDGVFELPVDYVLSHNLKINNRVDDSVIKFVNNRKMIIRRSRGFIPHAFNLDSEMKCISFGAELYNSLCFLKDKKVVQSQYVGNTANFKTYDQFFKKVLNFFNTFLKMDKLDAVFCDLHPLYNTSTFAEKFAASNRIRLLKIQHHFAHGMSVMAEKNLGRAVSISVDGVGYGYDGSVWGGEVLLIDFENMRFRRLGRLEEFKLIGGDLAGKFPLRILFSLIYDELGDYTILEKYEKYLRKNESFELLASQLEKGLASITTTSTGRMLDATSVMLEVCFERTYEGEPAMKLEAIATGKNLDVKPKIRKYNEFSVFPIWVEDGLKMKKDDVKVLKTKRFIVECLESYLSGEKKEDIGRTVIEYLGNGLATVAADYAEKYSLPVVMSGGVAYNTHFTSAVERVMKSKGIEFFTNELTASGDNGISFGQIYLAKYIER